MSTPFPLCMLRGVAVLLTLCGTSALTAQPYDYVCAAMSLTCGDSYMGNTLNATNSGTGENSTCGVPQVRPGIWFSFLGTGQQAEVNLCANPWDSRVSVYSGSCTWLTCIGGNDNGVGGCPGTVGAKYSWLAEEGVMYYIKVHGSVNEGSFTLSLNCSVPNDAVCNALPLACGMVAHGTTAGATNSGVGEADACGQAQTSAGVWYSVTGNYTIYRAELCNGPTPMVISVYEGSCSAPSCLGSGYNNLFCVGNFGSMVEFLAVPGRTYYLKVHGAVQPGAFDLQMSCSYQNGLWNDYVCDAVPFTCADDQVVMIMGATDMGLLEQAGSCGNMGPAASVWGTVVGNGYLMTASLYQGSVAVYSYLPGPPDPEDCEHLVCVEQSVLAPGTNDEATAWYSNVGQTYYLRCAVPEQPYIISEIGGILLLNHTFLSVSCGNSGPAAQNDLVCNATELTCGAQVQQSSAIVTSIGEEGSGSLCAIPFDHPVEWYKVLGAGQTLTAKVYGMGGTVWGSSALQVFRGPCTALTCLGTSMDLAGPDTLRFTWTAEAGVYYYIGVGSPPYTSVPFTLRLECPTVPPNDAPCNAVPVTCNSSTPGTTVGSLNTGGAPFCLGPLFNGVWYSLVGNGQLTMVDLCATPSVNKVTVFSGSCAVPVCVGGNDNLGPACVGLSYTWTALQDTTYYILVQGSPSDAAFTLNVTCALANDGVCSATSLVCGSVVQGTTVGATNSGVGEADACGPPQVGGGVWYAVTAAGYYRAELCTGSVPMALGVYEGTCSALTCLGSAYENMVCTSTFGSVQEFQVKTGETYYLKVHGPSGPGIFTLELSCPDTPGSGPSDWPCDADELTCTNPEYQLALDGLTNLGSYEQEGCGVLQQQASTWVKIQGTGDLMLARLNGGDVAVYSYVPGLPDPDDCDHLVCVDQTHIPDDPLVPWSLAGGGTLWMSDPGRTYYLRCYKEELPMPFGNWESMNFSCNVIAAPNDHVCDAIELTCGLAVTAWGIPTLSGPEEVENTCGEPFYGPLYWYKVTGTGMALTARAYTGAAGSVGMVLYRGSCDALTCMGSGTAYQLNDTLRYTWSSEAGVPYYIGLSSGYEAALTIRVDCTPLPENDMACGAIPAACGSSTPGTTVGATPDPVNSAFWTEALNTYYPPPLRGVWYSVPGNGLPMQASLSGVVGGPSWLVRFTGSCAGLTWMQEGGSLTWNSQVGVTSYILVCGPHTPFPFNLNITGCATSVQLAARGVLEGAYDPATGLMNDALRSLPSFPLSDPYPGLGYVHTGAGNGPPIDASVLSVAGNDAIVDWVVLELRNPASPATVLSSRSVLLQRDGDIVDLDGTSPVTFPVPQGNYRVALRHRNHLGVMPLTAFLLVAGPLSVDFGTTELAFPFGEARKHVVGAIPQETLWSGDVTFDGEIKYTGIANDRDPILQRIGGSVPTNTVTGYHGEDVNLDGQVKYTGVANDRDPILQNIGGSVPTNTRVEQLP